MTLFRSIVLLIIVGAAVTAGWFIEDTRPQKASRQLEIPDNIDYYMSGVNYRAMNQQGDLHFNLRSPFLEHYIREDVSHIQSPDIDYNSAGKSWLINSDKGLLTHQQQTLELIQQASMKRNNPDDPFLLTSDQIILKPEIDLVQIPKPLSMTTNQLRLLANSAHMDMKQSYYTFQNVNAIYSPRQPKSSIN